MNPMTAELNARGLVVRCVYISRHHNGFGFTLRHFIVYPPELYANDGSSGESNAQPRIGQVTEPVDTIFVKSVLQHGPAAHAGLCVGDRVVSVNGETIAGKSYDQVVHLIKRSPSPLCMEVTPKQYDTLQLFYEEKAYRPETNQRPSTVAPSSGVGGANGLGLNSISILVNQNNQNNAEAYQFYHSNYHSPPSLPSVNQQIQNNHSQHSLHHQQHRQVQPVYSFPSFNSSYESVFLPNSDQSLNTVGNMSSSSTFTNSQQQDQQKHNQIQQQPLFSHLPRPTPYKSTVVWSHLTPSQQQQQQQQQHQQQQQQQHQQQQQQQQQHQHQQEQQQKLSSKHYNSGKSHQHQPQTYYPFNQGSGTNTGHRGIREDAGSSGAKSHESVLAVTSDSTDNSSNRYGSMECLPSGGSNSARVGGSNYPGSSNESSVAAGGNPWKMIPGYRYSISTAPSDVDLRRESTISLPPSSAMVPSYQISQPAAGSGGRTVVVSGYPANVTMIDGSGPYSIDGGDVDHYSLGYEGKMVDRIRRSCEQKEEFLKRPNQPLVWAPITPNSAAAAGFPKELYAQPQKFQKVPWPPANVNTGYSLQQSMSTPTASSIGHQPNSHVSRASSSSEPFRYTDSSPSHRKTTERISNESSESGIGARMASNRPGDWSSTEYGSAKNRLTVVGSGKLHCDPPPDWKAPSVIVHSSNSSAAPSGNHETSTIPKSNGTTTSNDETEYYVQNRNDALFAHGPVVKSKSVKLPVPAPATNSNNCQSTPTSSAQPMRPIRPNQLLLSKKLIFKNNHNHSSSGKPTTALHASLDTDVILRKRENDPDYDNDRVVRRVSYLKATSSPIDMERKSSKSSSPTTPTKSCDENVLPLPNLRKSTTDPGTSPGRRRSMANRLGSDFLHKGRIVRLKQFFEERTQPSSLFKFHADSPSAEFRHFGSFRSEKSPDDSEIIKDGPVHFKVRAGENKKVGYYRSWRPGYAQIRRSGCLYLSKERITKDSISGMEENAAILCVGLKDGISIEPAEDYSKRKYVLRLKTCSASTSNGGGVGVPNVTLLTSPAESINSSLLPHVEILIQADDPVEMTHWLKSLQQQQDNNNYFCADKQPNNSSNSSAIGTAANANVSNSSNSSTEFSQKSSLFRSLLPSQGGPHSTTSSSSNTTNNFLTVNSAGVLVSNPTSPKSKTWKGKVAKQWKKMQHISVISPSSHHGSAPYRPGPIPETGASFGVPLEDCPVGEHNPSIPRVMEICVNTIESRGLGITGIYRIPGNSAAVAALTDSLNKGNEPSPEQDPRWNDVHVISSMLKSFLRNLPDPLLTSERYQDFIRGVFDAEEEVQFERVNALIEDLPEINYETLRYLILHLKKVSENSERNRMESRNLAIVFGPTLVRTADDTVASMVNDMKQQCKLVELLINMAYQFFPPHDQNSPPVHSGSDIQGSSASTISGPLIPDPVAKFESDIRTSLIQAAQRKVSRQQLQPPHNTYGLPAASSSSNANERGAVDESGLIRSYAGLGAETEQRVRQFEMETRAMLTRDGRSPNPASSSPAVFPNTVVGSSATTKHTHIGVGKSSQNPPEDEERIRLDKLRLEAEWRKAKDDLENEDFYDQLADNPSSIVHHKEHGLPPFPLLSHNVSSSSVSSSNSAGGNTADGNEVLSSGVISPSMSVLTWPMKLGPTPFKPTYSPVTAAVPSLPPKPPHVTLNSSSSSSSSTTTKLTKVLTVSGSPSSLLGNPLRKVSSVEHLTSTGGTKIRDGFIVSSDRFDSSKVTGRETLTRLKRTENKPAVPYDPKVFGSLDSLRDIANGGSKEDLSPRSSDGSDLVASMKKVLDKKFESLRPSKNLGGNIEDEQQTHHENDIKQEEASQHEKTSVKLAEANIPKPLSVSDGDDSLSVLLSSTKPNGINKGRSRSLIERRKDLDEEEVEKVTEPVDHNYVLLKLSYRDPSLHRVSNTSNGSSWSGEKPGENGEDRIPSALRSGESEQYKISCIQHRRQPTPSLTKEAKTASNNRLTKESQRRHSLSGTADILRCVLEDHNKLTSRLGGHASSGGHGNHGKNVSADTLATALAANNILESHV